MRHGVQPHRSRRRRQPGDQPVGRQGVWLSLSNTQELKLRNQAHQAYQANQASAQPRTAGVFSLMYAPHLHCRRRPLMAKRRNGWKQKQGSKCCAKKSTHDIDLHRCVRETTTTCKLQANVFLPASPHRSAETRGSLSLRCLEAPGRKVRLGATPLLTAAQKRPKRGELCAWCHQSSCAMRGRMQKDCTVTRSCQPLLGFLGALQLPIALAQARARAPKKDT